MPFESSKAESVKKLLNAQAQPLIKLFMSLINLVAAICLHLPHPAVNQPPSQIGEVVFTPAQVTAWQLVPASDPSHNTVAKRLSPESEPDEARLLEPWDTSKTPPVKLLEPWNLAEAPPVMLIKE